MTGIQPDTLTDNFTADDLIWANKDYIHYHILYLPLSDDGETINMLLVVTQFNKR